VNHRAASSFWQRYGTLPKPLRKLADKNFKLLESNSSHPSLNFKPVGKYWSARVGLNHRAVAVKSGEDFIWFWIGEHDPYERLIK
jgi:hypothetical protein